MIIYWIIIFLIVVWVLHYYIDAEIEKTRGQMHKVVDEEVEKLKKEIAEIYKEK